MRLPLADAIAVLWARRGAWELETRWDKCALRGLLRNASARFWRSDRVNVMAHMVLVVRDSADDGSARADARNRTSASQQK